MNIFIQTNIMAELQILTQFSELFEEVKRSLENYNDNLKNDQFIVDEKEESDKAFKRGETLFDQFDENLNNINILLSKREEINQFFEKCQQNKQNIINEKNEIINKMIRIQKNNKNISKEKYLEIRNELNKKREETLEEKNRRECEEMLEEINEQKKYVEEMTQNMIKEKNELYEMIEKAEEKRKELNITEEFNKVVNKYVKICDIPNTVENEMKTSYKLKSIQQKRQLEEWTGLECGEILFDSDVDNWSENTTNFNEKIIGKKQLSFIIEDEDEEIFGYYLNTQVVEKYNQNQSTDSKSFLFNLQSNNNRLQSPMKFEIKDLEYGGITLHTKLNQFDLINLGDIYLYKEARKNKSYCNQTEDRFDYHGIEKAVCGKQKSGRKGEHFKPKRILVIQMK